MSVFKLQRRFPDVPQQDLVSLADPNACPRLQISRPASQLRVSALTYLSIPSPLCSADQMQLISSFK